MCSSPTSEAGAHVRKEEAACLTYPTVSFVTKDLTSVLDFEDAGLTYNSPAEAPKAVTPAFQG